MNQKTISLPEEIYLKLKKHKRKGESFPELISRLIKKEESWEKEIDNLFGCLKEDDEWDKILEDIYEDRKKPSRI